MAKATQYTKKDIREFIADALKEHYRYSEPWTLSDRLTAEFQADDARADGAFAVLLDMAKEFGVKVEGLNK